MYDFSKILAENIRKQRKKHEISQMELALRTGVSTAFINAIENKQKWVSASTLARLSKALDVKPYELFLSGDENDKDLNIIAGKHKHMVSEIKDILERYGVGELE